MLHDLWFETCKSGDALSWERLIGHFSRLVYSVPRQMGLSSDACDDVSQDTFLALYQRRGSLKDGSAIPKWLVTTARRIALRQRERCYRELSLQFVRASQAQSVEETAVEALWSRFRRAKVRAAMERLPETNRKTLNLLYFEGRSYAEAASSLGCPIGSIGPVRQRSLEQLRAQLLRSSAYPPAPTP